MKILIFILMLFLLLGCREEQTNIYMTTDKAAWYFSQIEKACQRDNGKLWGEKIYGPLMFIDRPTRRIFANMPDEEGILKYKDGIYTGTYPREMIIDNNSKTIGGILYAIAALTTEEDTLRNLSTGIQGLYHSLLIRNGTVVPRYNTRQMDEGQARLWLKLEWHALRNVFSQPGEINTQALRDALIFRGTRRELYPWDITDENIFESFQGLATLTYILCSSTTSGEEEQIMMRLLDYYYNIQSYSRTYGYIHGALYGYIAHRKGFDFRTIKGDTVDLADMTRRLYDIQLPEICRDVAGSLVLSYDLDGIQKEEEERLKNIRERLHRRISAFTEKPVVFFELESPYFDFEPQDIRSLDTLGTIYNSIRVLDNWGKLTVVTGGCLISSNLKTIRITARNFSESKNHFSGDGWDLLLNSDWQIVRHEENYYVRKLMP